MKLRVSTIIGVVLWISTTFIYVSMMRPVGWFDSVTGLVLGGLVFFFVKTFKGIKK